ncbi:TetR/AcrR family transcriptional regulator [Solitalea canadensis]|uniref:Transcriptional regulator n=1 Tax=Solitalea canadensis (strain ATCC 29591 / DSM 3403 / JCM 21819 / LMG 8368 / NBRC 15130 / NCIMB 12057 / USAM 9D) TaxID=929556 RepID=H8KRC1_SOLCM|nr:TetR/AcrR family transcriptional regulator [Solitalea canadensis]AFD07388.1 transcriptional regulator [Solitalea canadensis DSM 3403]
MKQPVVDKRQSILNSSLAIITEHGFHGSSMKMISEKAGVAAGTIYLYFTNKEELINELFLEIRRRINDVVVNAFDEALAYRTNFSNIWHSLYDYYLNNDQVFKFIEQYSSSPFIVESTKRKGEKILAPVYEILGKGIDQGYIKPMHLTALLSLFYGPVIALVRFHQTNEINLNEDVHLDEIIESCWLSVKK